MWTDCPWLRSHLLLQLCSCILCSLQLENQGIFLSFQVTNGSVLLFCRPFKIIVLSLHFLHLFPGHWRDSHRGHFSDTLVADWIFFSLLLNLGADFPGKFRILFSNLFYQIVHFHVKTLDFLLLLLNLGQMLSLVPFEVLQLFFQLFDFLLQLLDSLWTVLLLILLLWWLIFLFFLFWAYWSLGPVVSSFLFKWFVLLYIVLRFFFDKFWHMNRYHVTYSILLPCIVKRLVFFWFWYGYHVLGASLLFVKWG